ncbi:acyl carrier protein [Roseivivax sp. THAF40]|uniref:acyl carrier protein n=1 Tax=unclassified Roseivivax TaxID=2639302 RepID=UPI0012691D0C|nr:MULTISPECIES: acyl carrier protein [unclassified Roseivivax]QFS83112.1 acyl carrier protein [Roseivivax sp. THAF197b]QFT46856.1 acyl carrier protein [Roseivivax sp. THAF40]
MADTQTILDKVTVIIRDLFDEYEGPVTMETTADDVPQWDSLSHVRLMVMIEMELGVHFSTSEMQSFRNLGDLVEAAAKQSG